MKDDSIQQKYTAALDALVAQVKEDRSILAAILGGSLSHDTVWRKSDIDLVLVTLDDRKIDVSDLALYADGVNVHAILLPRAELRKTIEGSVHHSFMHSFLAKGRLLYTHDPSIADLCKRLQSIGTRDATVQLLRAATEALPPIDKAHKWFVTRRDFDYAALWLLYAATPLAAVEVIGAGLLVDREVLPQALKLNPTFFRTAYTDLLNDRKTEKKVKAALDAVDEYVASRAPTLFAPVIDYLRQVGDVRSSKDLQDYFKKNFDVGGVITACEYLCQQGILVQASTPVQLTRRSNVEVQELAFFFAGDPPDAF
jgi:hypothetical protein